MMNPTEKLLAEIEAFLEIQDMSATRFGVLSRNDRHLVRRLRSGGTVMLASADAIRAFMASYKTPRVRRGNASVAA